MNYSLDMIPISCNIPIVWMDITVGGEVVGRIYIRLFRDIFPAGVENFVRIADGKTFRLEKRGIGKYKYYKEVRRTYAGCKFFNFQFNKYMVTGDIYNNNGTSAGTIYCDKPIPAYYSDYYYPHEVKGMISLVPYRDEETGQLFYDSTFMVLMSDINSSNEKLYHAFDTDQIVIGYIYQGIEIFDKINKLIQPFAGRKYPDVRICASGVYQNQQFRRRRPISPQEQIRNKQLQEKSRFINSVAYMNNEQFQTVEVDAELQGEADLMAQEQIIINDAEGMVDTAVVAGVDEAAGTGNGFF